MLTFSICLAVTSGNHFNKLVNPFPHSVSPVSAGDGPASNRDSCPPGFRFFLISCIDVDECSEGSHDCDPSNEMCLNEEGGFRCRPVDALPGQVRPRVVFVCCKGQKNSC